MGQAADEAQGALVQEPALTGHGDEDLWRKNDLQPLPGAPNVGFAGSDVPFFFHRVECWSPNENLVRARVSKETTHRRFTQVHATVEV